MIATIYEKIKEICIANETEANKLLQEGWSLLKVVTETDMSGKSATKFVLGRKSPEFIPANKYMPDGPLEEAIDKLPWRRNKRGEWCFAKQAGVSVAPELEDAITKSGGKLSLGGYVYSMSGQDSLFFNRRKSETEELAP
jgi:hypothetical protein